MKKIFVIIGILFASYTQAQVTKVSLQASGLTCSMCSNAINKSLQSLDFVSSVKSNIQNSSFDISIKPGAAFTFDELKKKVEDAGFFVANMQAEVNFNGVKIEKDKHLQFAGMTLHFLNAKGQLLNGTKTLQLLDKGYVSSKIFKKNQALTNMECYQTGVAGNCCTKEGLASGERVYHVSI